MEGLFGYFYTLWCKLECSRLNTFWIMNFWKSKSRKSRKVEKIKKLKMCTWAHLLYPAGTCFNSICLKLMLIYNCMISPFRAIKISFFSHIHTAIHLFNAVIDISILFNLFICKQAPRGNSMRPQHLYKRFFFNSVTDQRTDGPTDGRTDGWTDGRTHPLIEMRGRI